MKSKKLIASILTASLLTFQASSVFAAGSEGIEKAPSAHAYTDAKVISTPIKPVTEARRAHFNSYSGKVKSIKEYPNIEGSKIIELEDGQGGQANVIVSTDTYFTHEKEIEVDSNITVYYDANMPMIMIYPPQYKADVVVAGAEKENIKVDLFKMNLISADGQLKIGFGEKTEIVTQDGKKYEGNLSNKNLVVYYTVATKSIPAQTTPSKVVVLNKKASEGIGDSKYPHANDREMIRRLLQLLMKMLGDY
jgi:hypothetical protein